LTSDGRTISNGGLKAQVLAGYIDAKNGKQLAYALYVNNVSTLKSIADVTDVFEDKAEISNIIYESN
jgi:D-alanyl-D-alanine carboxypeptidase/D-alanyl-D-alanine-endopeptidase (penicillin-binding protein 4)